MPLEDPCIAKWSSGNKTHSSWVRVKSQAVSS